jgi:hypothetical protein
MTHPCLTCGACCASFRVDFSVYETQELGGDVPDGLAVDVTDTLRRMRGTDHSPPRCAALTGKVGTQAACGMGWRNLAAVAARAARRRLAQRRAQGTQALAQGCGHPVPQRI